MRLYSVRQRRFAAIRRCCGARFFDVDVLAGLACPDGLERMPVVGSRKRYCVDRLILQQLAVVHVRRGLVLAFLVEHLELGGDVRLVDITERDDLDVWHRGPGAHVAGSTSAATDDRYPDGVVRARKTADSRTSRQHCRAHQEVSSVHSRPSNHAVSVHQRTPPVRFDSQREYSPAGPILTQVGGK